MKKAPCVLLRSLDDLVKFSIPAVHRKVLENGAVIYLMEQTDTENEKSESVGKFFKTENRRSYYYGKEHGITDIRELFRVSQDMINECYPVSIKLWNRLHSTEWDKGRLLSFNEIKRLVCAENGIDAASLPSTCHDFVYADGTHVFRYKIFNIPGHATLLIADTPVCMAAGFTPTLVCA